VLAALGFWTVPTFLYAFGAVVVWLVWEIALAGRRRLLATRLVPALVATALLTVVLYAPVLVTAGVHALTGNQFVTPRGWSYFAHHLPSSLRATFARWHRDQAAPVWVLLALGFVVSCLPPVRPGRFRVSPAAAAVAFVAPVVAIQHVVPFERVWLFLLPLYFILACAGLPRVDVPRWAGSTAAIGLACLLGALVLRSGSILTSQETGAFPDAAAVADQLQGKLAPQDAVVTRLPASLPELQYYFHAKGLPPATLVQPPEDAPHVFVIEPADSSSPGLHGQEWQSPIEEARLSGSVIYRFDRR
jgi:hypothetical protein